jgi:hypothetical protein
MAAIPQCDRCKNVKVQVVTVLGIDLCNDCVSAFRDWAAGKFRACKDGRAAYRERLGQCFMVISRDGYVTSSTLTELAGIPRTLSNAYLQNSAKAGRLRKLGSGRFGRPLQEAAE